MDFSWLTEYIKSFLNSGSSSISNLKKLFAVLLLSSAVIYAGIKAKTEGLESPEGTEEELIDELIDELVPEEQEIISSEDSYEQCKSNTLPSFINVSMTWGGPENMEALSAFKALSPPSVIITSAGSAANSVPPSPLIDPNKERGSKEFGAILVGSVDPYGDRSYFSQQGEEVAIVAPSNYQISTLDGEGNYKKFSGTSGAVTLVTGSLAGFSQLAGYQPTAEEAKILLESTAIPLKTSNTDPRMNGAGMVNAYKLGMVGKRLKEECGEDINCFKNKIVQDSTYEFPEDEGLFEAVEEAFPECSADKCLERSDSCTDKEAVFKRLRKAAFLNPSSNKEMWRYLSCIYASSGFPDNARGMRNIYNALLGASPAETFRDRIIPYIDRSCNVDEDCILVPKCSFNFGEQKYYSDSVSLTPANKDYVTECQGPALCNGKCRCGSEEDSDMYSQSLFGGCFRPEQVDNLESCTSPVPITLRTRCVSSQCVKVEYYHDDTLINDNVTPESKQREPDQGGSGQR